MVMFPVLFSIGNLSVSSFGVFLALGFLLGIFLVWRLARAWDMDEEKILDLTLLTILGGLIGARIYFAIEYLPLFSNPLNLILVNKVPGFSFWGGFVGGWLTLYFFARRFRLDFWQVADFASVGVLAGLVLSDIGCFLGGCNVGIPSKTFLAVTMVGVIGKRFPVQVAEAALLYLALRKVWSKATHFHQRGQIASLSFIYIGLTQLVSEPFKQTHAGAIFSVIFVLLGLTIFYRLSKQNPLTHLKIFGHFCFKLFTDPQTARQVVQNFSKSCYNQKTVILWKLKDLNKNIKKLLRRSNVKFS